MDQAFSLRPATTEDLKPVLQIENHLYPSPWTEENFKAELIKPYSHFLVLTDDETDTQIAGYIVFWTLFDECQILNIAVDLPFRGMGFAKQMLRKAASLAINKGIRKLVLDVRKSNMAAIQLYQNLNFSITHIRKGFYSNGDDAYQMTLSLEGDALQL
jgi:ribosomal-protein-alanine N-acetyltransferase